MQTSAAVVGEHWRDRRQGHSSGKSQLNHGPGMRQLQSVARDAGCTDAGLEVAVWSGENQSSEVRSAAAEALGKLGEHAASAVPALTKYLEHENGDVRRGGW